MTQSTADAAASLGDSEVKSLFAMPADGWKQLLQTTWREAGEDNIGLAAAGVAFYGFLAIVPLLGAIVLSYGLLAEPATVLKNMTHLASVMPGDAAKLVGEQLMNVVKTSETKKGFGLLLALALALFGARNGAGAIITALNIAYEEKETRSFVRLNLTALAITGGAVLIAIVALVAIAALGHLEKLVPGAPGVALALGKIFTYVLVAVGGAAGAATLYRFAPNHAAAKWVWFTPGSLVAATLWLLLTVGFGIYAARFGNYNATYGSLGAVAATLTWLYLSSYVLLLGAELNSALEHQAKENLTARGQPGGAATAAYSGAPAIGDNAADTGAVEAVKRLAAEQGAPEPVAVGGLAALSAGRKARRTVGRENVALAPSLLATTGLALLRKQDRAAIGIALLTASGLLAWFSE